MGFYGGNNSISTYDVSTISTISSTSFNIISTEEQKKQACKAAFDKYMLLTEVEYDGGPIFDDDSGKFFADEQELEGHCSDEDIHPSTLRLHPCTERKVGCMEGEAFIYMVIEDWASNFDDCEGDFGVGQKARDLAAQLSECLAEVSPTIWDVRLKERITPFPVDPDQDYDPEEDRYSDG